MSGAATVRQWARDVRRFADEWPAQGGDVLAARVEQRLLSDTGGDGSFSHMRGGGTATVDVTAAVGSADVTGGGSRRVWAILEDGTSGHTVRARRGSALATPAGPRAMVQVSGVTARRTWTDGVRAGLPAVVRDGERSFAQLGS